MNCSSLLLLLKVMLKLLS